MTVPRGVKITDRDREILNWIGRHGCRRSQIGGASESGVGTDRESG
jgi:hypothetical protein